MRFLGSSRTHPQLALFQFKSCQEQAPSQQCFRARDGSVHGIKQWTKKTNYSNYFSFQPKHWQFALMASSLSQGSSANISQGMLALRVVQDGWVHVIKGLATTNNQQPPTLTTTITTTTTMTTTAKHTN